MEKYTTFDSNDKKMLDIIYQLSRIADALELLSRDNLGDK